jgi:hypothetical protein
MKMTMEADEINYTLTPEQYMELHDIGFLELVDNDGKIVILTFNG